MDWILTKLVAGFDFIKVIIDWTIAYPEAAFFWAGVTSVILNYVVKLTPTQIDDSIYSAIKRAIVEGLARMKNRSVQ